MTTYKTIQKIDGSFHPALGYKHKVVLSDGKEFVLYEDFLMSEKGFNFKKNTTQLVDKKCTLDFSYLD